MSSFENLLLSLILRGGINELRVLGVDEDEDYEYVIDEDWGIKKIKEIEVELIKDEICFNTKNVKTSITYENFLNEFKKLQTEKFANSIKQIVDITNDCDKYSFYNLDNVYETYDNILYDVKTFYICLLTDTNKKYFVNFIDCCNKKKFKPQNNYVLILNNKCIYQINLKNKIETIMLELEKKIKLNSTPDDIIDSNEFIQKIKEYAVINNSQINDLTEQITNVSIKSKVNMITTLIYHTTSKTTNKFIKYDNDLKNIMKSLNKNDIYICNTTKNTFYFVSMILGKFNFPYNCVKYPLQNCILILSPKFNLYLNTIENLSGINKTRIDALFEKLFKNNNQVECCICYKKMKKNNVCYNCYQYNGCAQCGKKLFNKKSFDCVLCKS